jgi:hypothetical protein
MISLAWNVDLIAMPVAALLNTVWRTFIMGTLCTVGAALTEFRM